MPAALREVGGALLDLVFPSRCPACGEDPAPPSPFCALCDGAIEPAPDAGDGIQAGALFGGPIADAIHALKYAGRADAAGPLGRWLAGRVRVPDDAAVLWVPLGAGRRVERTYDQAMLLAASLARASGRPLVRGALRRVRETPPQVGRDRSARERNVAGAFVASPAVAGRTLLLLDDVVTTGATVEAASRALREAGVRRVHVAALARAG
jgi:ComF family protein